MRMNHSCISIAPTQSKKPSNEPFGTSTQGCRGSTNDDSLRGGSFSFAAFSCAWQVAHRTKCTDINPKKNTRRSTAQHRRRTGTATQTHPSTSRQSYKAFDSISMFAAVERGTARTPWEFSIPRSSLENEGCTGARRQLQSPAIKSTPSARPRVTRGSALVDVVALVFPRHSG